MKTYKYLNEVIRNYSPETLEETREVKGIPNKDVADLIFKIDATKLFLNDYVQGDVGGISLKDPKSWQTLGFDDSKSIIDKINSLATIKLWKEAGNRDTFFNIDKNGQRSVVAITPHKYKSENENKSSAIQIAKQFILRLGVTTLKASDFFGIALSAQPMSDENVAKLGLTIVKDVIDKINKIVNFSVNKLANSNILDFVLIDESTKMSPPFLAVSIPVSMFEAPEESKIDDDYRQIIKAGVTLLVPIFSSSIDDGSFLDKTFPEGFVSQDFINQFGLQDYRAQIAGALAVGELRAKKDWGRNIVFILTRNGKEMQFNVSISVFSQS